MTPICHLIDRLGIELRRIPCPIDSEIAILSILEADLVCILSVTRDVPSLSGAVGKGKTVCGWATAQKWHTLPVDSRTQTSRSEPKKEVVMSILAIPCVVLLVVVTIVVV